MKNLFLKLYYKVLRSNNYSNRKLCKIQSGPLKGYSLSLACQDNRYHYGTYESEGVELLRTLIHRDSIVYDLGANIGYFTLLFNKYSNKVYSFEPIPANLDLIKLHISANAIDNVEVFPYAITAKDNVLEFPLIENHSAFTYKRESKNFSLDRRMLKVEGRSLDSLIHERNLLPPTLIKIDVEGAEFDVLQGAKETIMKHHPTLLLATHESQIKGIRSKCLDFMKTLGYNCTPTGEKKTEAEQEDFICKYGK